MTPNHPPVQSPAPVAEVPRYKGKVSSVALGPETRGKYVIMKEFGGAFGH